MVTRHRSEGDRRRSYLRLLARSHLAAALWRQASTVPAASAGTRPAVAIAPGAIDAVTRRRLPLPRLRPRHVSDVRNDGDLVVTVCDLAHEELGGQAVLHWSVPDPVPASNPESFDAALDELDQRVRMLAPRMAAAP
jgi:ArsR family transcriptional regulator, arsenate/arsenite/antimonite-responsive transcriptional repressor / arsenate reductase (thioredoxin)